MVTYLSTGKLTGTIPAGHRHEANLYMSQFNMAEFLPPELEGVVTSVVWSLGLDGEKYAVRASAARELTAPELKELADWTSGQNSDGMGEGFEQQHFAEINNGECGECEQCVNGYTCNGDGYSGMISFDWMTNDSTFVRVNP